MAQKRRKSRKRMIGIRLPVELIQRVDDAAGTGIFSRSDIIRFLLDRALNANFASELSNGVRAAV